MTANQAGAQSYEHWEPHDANAALRNQITQTRADLGETISELAARTDVKARAKQAVSQARERTRNALRERTQFAAMRTRDATRTGASSAQRQLGRAGQQLGRAGQQVNQQLDRFARSPMSVAVGSGVGALAGLGIYALLRRRLPLRARLAFGAPGLLRLGRRSRSIARGRWR